MDQLHPGTPSLVSNHFVAVLIPLKAAADCTFKHSTSKLSFSLVMPGP
jgi:hypothetical protein